MDTEAFPNRRKRHPSLLVVTRFSPLPGSAGAGTYLFSILRHLHESGVRVSVCWSERPGLATFQGWYLVPKEFARVAELIFPESIAIGRLRIFPKLWWLPFKARCLDRLKRALFALGFGSLFRKVRPAPPSGGGATTAEPVIAWDRPLEPAERDFFLNTIAKIRPDALLFNFCWLTPLAESLESPGDYLKITITHDLRHRYSVLEDGRIEYTDGDSMSRELEQRALRGTDAIVAIREDDGDEFAKLLPEKQVIVAPPSFLPAPVSGEPLPDHCLFVASDAEPNREGIAWFIDRVWPLVRAARPGAELHLCGSVCHGFTTNAPGVTLRGFVESLDEEYREAAVVVVPLLRGSGVKIKLMEALAHGKACVTTPIGTEGLPILESCARQAGNADDFAHELVSLLEHPEARWELETRALAVIGEHFSPASCYGPLLHHILRS